MKIISEDAFYDAYVTGVSSTASNCEGCQFRKVPVLCKLVSEIVKNTLDTQVTIQSILESHGKPNFFRDSLKAQIEKTEITGSINSDCPVFKQPSD